MASEDKEIVVNSHLYRVDGEIGRFTFTCHHIIHAGKCQYNTALDLFSGLQGLEFYKTVGFKDIAMIYGDTVQSFRKTAKLINRIRYHIEGGTPSRTLHECTEKEGQKVLCSIEENTKKILVNNSFSEDGKCQMIKAEYTNEEPATISEDQISAAIDQCMEVTDIKRNTLESNPVPYENPRKSTFVAIDDVIVKKQEETRELGVRKQERGKRKYVHNTIAHISQEDGKCYVLNGHGIKNVLVFLMAFLFHNGLIGTRIQFFTDGHKTLNQAILKSFNWYKNIGIILDWYHLEKKCKEKLSLALKGRFIRNEVLEELMPLLWHGSTDEAVEYIKCIAKSSIKDTKILDKLIEYFITNKSYIPCYAVRKKLGLCNSSAIGEKMNDLIVSERQKHNGMSWSKSGSVGLATITALKRNKESDKWFMEQELDFKLAA
jgi:hypothetical protein